MPRTNSRLPQPVTIALRIVLLVAALALAFVVLAPLLWVWLYGHGLSQQAQQSPWRCHEVPAEVVTRIEAGLTMPGGGRLRGAKAVNPPTTPRLWIVAADILGIDAEDKPSIGVWRIEDASASPAVGMDPTDPIYAVNDVAKDVSGFPPRLVVPRHFETTMSCVKVSLAESSNTQ